MKDWTELDSGGTLDLPIRGKTYQVPSPSGRIGLRVQAFMEQIVDASRHLEQGQPVELNEQVLDDANEIQLYEDVLGPARDEMLADDVPIEAIKHAALTTMMWIAFDRDTAEAVWEGKAPAAAVRAKASAEEPTTRSQGSTSGTSRRRGRRRGGRAKDRRSGGGRSSTGGHS